MVCGGTGPFKAVGEFFHTGKLLKQINTTLIALIPKVNMPLYVSDYRPISCCNVLYKAITKIIVKRIHRILPLMIDNSQNAFVPGRSITDNILLAQELLAGYNQMRLPNRCTLKVDIQKAYDSVEWDFLLEVLRTENKSSKEPDYFIPISAAGTATDTGLSGVSRRHFAYQIPREEDEKNGSGNAKVAWEQICKPKQEGGLGIRSLMITNQALMLKQLWRLIQNDGTSIWVEWIQRHRLRQSTIWTFNGATGSWGWKKLLKLRPLLQRGVIYKVGDGSSFSLWQDVWHERGPLCLTFPRGPVITGLPLSSPLSSVLQRNQWSWPASTDADIAEIISQLPPTQPSAADMILLEKQLGGDFDFEEFYDLATRVLNGDSESMANLKSLKVRWEQKFKTRNPALKSVTGRPSTPFRPRISFLPRRILRTGTDPLPEPNVEHSNILVGGSTSLELDTHGCSSSPQSGLVSQDQEPQALQVLKIVMLKLHWIWHLFLLTKRSPKKLRFRKFLVLRRNCLGN
ncbi:UNVERIFIED_CONTAM: hypothetical protein Scaly_3104100 [Sesamum calycinum]|uniref:Reverse transcriptase domain-containing protein n=1 Tax=Sesamum calycinum TaxID=2727403 RepID=A0AAW2JPD2_9LAMI